MINKDKIKNILFKKYDKLNILFYAFIVIIGVLLLGILRCYTGYDILQRKINILDMDLWSITHIIVCFILTYIYPHEWLFIFIASCCWELFECVCGAMNPKNMKYLIGSCKLFDLSSDDDKNWWYGKTSDILANSIGICLALLVHKFK